MDLNKMILKREAETGHRVFGPSGMERTLLCPASVIEGLKAPVSQTTSPYALRGTFLHDCIAEILVKTDGCDTIAGQHHELEMYLRDGTWSYETQPDDNYFTEEEAEWLRDCYEYQRDIEARHSGLVMYGIELDVDMESWDIPQVGGTADRVISSVKDKHIDVIDWKFGRGVQVFAEMNPQLLCYAACVIGHPTKFETLTVHVVQPPLDHFDEFTMTVNDLRDWIFNTLEPGIKAAQDPFAPYVPGTKQCKFCPAKMTCKARHTQADQDAIDVFEAASNLNSDTVSVSELVDLFKKYQSIKKYGEEIQKHLLKQGLAGKPIPTMKVVHGKVTRKWKDEVEARAFLKLCGIPEEKWTKPGKFVSPAQAEKLDRAFKRDEEFKSLISVQPGSPQLVDESDKREAYTPTAEAVKAFDTVPLED